VRSTPAPAALRCFAHTADGATFTVQVARREDRAHLVVVGDLGEPQVAVLAAHVRELVDDDVRRLVVDVSRVRLDRAASRALAELKGALRSTGASLSVTGARVRPRARRRRA
jgi:hypothetical protein